MRRRTMAAAMLLTVPALCHAQPATPKAQQFGQDNAVVLSPSAPESGRVERILDTLERHGLLPGVVSPPDGFSLRVGGIDGGGELALGPRWQHSRLAGGRLEVQASAVMSWHRDREAELRAGLPRLASGRLRLDVAATATELADERFYGLGNQSLEAHRNMFAMGRRSLRSTVTFRPARELTFEAGTGLLQTQLHDLAGLEVVGADFHYLHSRAAATLDYRDEPANPRSGGRYHVALHRFAGSRDEWASFSRVDAELEQHLPAWQTQLLTLRVVASFSEPDDGHDLPFYLMPTLGGSRLLRGFATDRFRDRNHAVLQAEYGWDLSPFLNTVLFYERGMVAPRASDLKWSSMRSDYGIGLRVGTVRSVAMRTDVAFGSGEGTRVTVRFNHAF